MSCALKGPCDSCPFRRDPFFPLHPDRVREIGAEWYDGGYFICHKTAKETGNGKNLVCAGAFSVALGEGFAFNSVVARLVAAEMGAEAVKDLENLKTTYDSFEEYAEVCEEMEE